MWSAFNVDQWHLDELHRRVERSYFNRVCVRKIKRDRKRQDETDKATIQEMYRSVKTCCLFPFSWANYSLKMCERLWERKERKVKEVLAGALAWQWSDALKRRFRSSALPVEWVIIVGVHVDSDLRHRLQRAHLGTEKQKFILDGVST